MLETSAESDWLNPLNSQIFFLIVTDLVQNDSFGFYDTDPGHGSDFIESSLWTFNLLCTVAKKPVTCHTKNKKNGAVSPFGWQMELQLFQRCSPAFNKTKNTEAWATDIVCQIIVFL